MALHLRRNLMFSSTLLLLLLQYQRYQCLAAEDTPGANNGEDEDDDDDDSSSEETAEDSNEAPQRRRKRHALGGDGGGGSADGESDERPNTPTVRAGIPGLPDPETILRIAEIVQAVGNRVLPLLTQGTSRLIATNTIDAIDDDDDGDAATVDAVDVSGELERHSNGNRNLPFLRMFKRRIDNFIATHRATII